ncbi:MAG: NTP transferase domain-containing protein [Deltaproteobacteria bacterium]|nr:NTP transferase domain-containing protein [Deltaproteobacteria bacterium]
MKVVILAAGQGSRLGPLSRSQPKALIPVLGKPLIHYMLDLCDKASIEEVFVVGGYEFFRLQASLETCKKQPHLLQNRDFKKGNLFSLATALPSLDGDFLIANADHIYPASLFSSFLKNVQGITAACDFDRPLGTDDMKIRCNKEGRLIAISKKLPVFDGGYIGMTYCSAAARKTYERAVEATFRRHGEKAVVEEVLETLILWGENPSLFDASGHGWYEIDTPSELRQVEAELWENPSSKT